MDRDKQEGAHGAPHREEVPALLEARVIQIMCADVLAPKLAAEDVREALARQDIQLGILVKFGMLLVFGILLQTL